MKILILNGSPRRNGNTDILTENFAKGAADAGHSVIEAQITEMDIHPCVGCMHGGKDKSSPCTQKDDMDQIYGEVMDSELIVFASPMYCWSITAQLKAVLDRLFALTEANGYAAIPKDCIMLMAAEGDDEENSEPAIRYYTSLSKNLGWRDRGYIIAGGVLHKGDIEGKPSLQEAYDLGRSL